MENQIICFINPKKFVGLLDIKDLRDDQEFLDSEILIYLTEDGHYTKGDFDPDRASAARIILVPDTFDFKYVPEETPFKVIYHNQTDVNDRVKPLENNPNFLGATKSMEEFTENGQETIYAKIAKSIKTP